MDRLTTNFKHISFDLFDIFYIIAFLLYENFILHRFFWLRMHKVNCCSRFGNRVQSLVRLEITHFNNKQNDLDYEINYIVFWAGNIWRHSEDYRRSAPKINYKPSYTNGRYFQTMCFWTVKLPNILIVFISTLNLA